MSTIALPLPFASATRRAWRRLTRPHVVLGLILLAMMLYLIMTPLLIMIQTTITWQPEDVRLARDVVPGEFTLFHWQRVFNSMISRTMLWTPLQNTLVTSNTFAKN